MIILFYVFSTGFVGRLCMKVDRCSSFLLLRCFVTFCKIAPYINSLTYFFVEKMLLSRYVGVHSHSADFYNVYLLARFLGETVVEATGNKSLCKDLGKNDTVRSI